MLALAGQWLSKPYVTLASTMGNDYAFSIEKAKGTGSVTCSTDARCLLPEKHGEETLPMREEDLSLPLQEPSDIPDKGIQTRNCYQKARHSG